MKHSPTNKDILQTQDMSYILLITHILSLQDVFVCRNMFHLIFFEKLDLKFKIRFSPLAGHSSLKSGLYLKYCNTWLMYTFWVMYIKFVQFIGISTEQI